MLRHYSIRMCDFLLQMYGRFHQILYITLTVGYVPKQSCFYYHFISFVSLVGKAVSQNNVSDQKKDYLNLDQSTRECLRNKINFYKNNSIINSGELWKSAKLAESLQNARYKACCSTTVKEGNWQTNVLESS